MVVFGRRRRRHQFFLSGTIQYVMIDEGGKGWRAEMFGNVSVLLRPVLCCVVFVGRGVVACCWANRWTVDGLWFSSCVCCAL